MSYAINTALFNAENFNGPVVSIAIPSFAKILFNQTSIVIDWSIVASATDYQVEVSLYPDFSTVFESATVSASTHSFTDSEVDDAKRYWRWRPIVTPGPTVIEPWSEVGSYWLNTGASQELILSRGEWGILDPDDIPDFYKLILYPIYTIVPGNVFRFQERNRLGELLSEFLTVKNEIGLSFSGQQYVAHQQLNEFRRYNNTLQTFFVAAFKDGERERPMPHIWKVQFNQEPTLSMIAAGRDDLVAGNISLTEV